MPEEQATADTTEQATAPAPTTKPAKIPKRVAAGKAAAQKTKEAWEVQKKALPEAEEKAKNDEAKAAAAKAKNTPASTSSPFEETPSPEKPEPKGFRSPDRDTTQWLTLGSIIVGLIGLYYKREELQAMFKALTQVQPSTQTLHTPVWRHSYPHRVTQRLPPDGLRFSI